MTRSIVRWTSLVMLAVLTLGGCATTGTRPGATEMVGRGLLGLVLSPLMIVGGIAQGLAFLPYTIGTGLQALNRALVDAQAVTLDDAYRAGYGVALDDPRVDQQTGEVRGETIGYGRLHPEAMAEATRALQRLLVAQGMSRERADQYVLGGVYTHVRSRGHLLLSLVHRPAGAQPFRAVSKHTGIATTFRPDQRGWREPYARDVDGRPIDEVIDWVAIDYALLQQDRVVATLFVLAAESVKSGARADDYWSVERRWLAGESAGVIEASRARIRLDRPASGRAPVAAREAVEEHLVAEQLGAPLEPLADALGHADGGRVARVDQADDVVAVHRGERVGQRAPRALRGVAPTPRVAAQHPAELEAGPALGVEEADASEQRPRRALLHGPEPVAAQLPVADDQRHLAPRLGARERLALAEVAHDLGVGADRRVGVEVLLAEHAEREPVGLERVHGQRPETQTAPILARSSRPAARSAVTLMTAPGPGNS
jgi:hypothetical protein